MPRSPRLCSCNSRRTTNPSVAGPFESRTPHRVYTPQIALALALALARAAHSHQHPRQHQHSRSHSHEYAQKQPRSHSNTRSSLVVFSGFAVARAPSAATTKAPAPAMMVSLSLLMSLRCPRAASALRPRCVRDVSAMPMRRHGRRSLAWLLERLLLATACRLVLSCTDKLEGVCLAGSA